MACMIRYVVDVGKLAVIDFWLFGLIAYSPSLKD